MKIEEVARIINHILPVESCYEANYGVWVFNLWVNKEDMIQVRVRKFPRTKMEMCLRAIGEAIQVQINELQQKRESNGLQD